MIDLDSLVFVKTWAANPGRSAVYHCFESEHSERSRCGLIWRAETVDWTERFAFFGLKARPCRRCWRRWRQRVKELEARREAEE